MEATCFIVKTNEAKQAAVSIRNSHPLTTNYYKNIKQNYFVLSHGHTVVLSSPTAQYSICILCPQQGSAKLKRCGVVCSTYTRFRIHRSWVRIRAPLIFTSWFMSLQQAEITGEVLTGRFSSSTAVVHSASYPPGKAHYKNNK